MARSRELLACLLGTALLSTAACCQSCTPSPSADPGGDGNIDNTPEATIITVDKAVKVSRMTGTRPQSESFPSPNNTEYRYNIGGTDLGIFWRMGGDKVGILFGDTFGKGWKPGYTPDWRSNAMAWSTDRDLDDGITFDGMITDASGSAKQIIYSAHNTSGQGDWSSIPTGAIRIGGKDYVHYMNVRAWNPKWVTNWSGFAVSEDNGATWTLHKELFAADSRFAQVAFWEKDGTVYALGSIIGRRGLPYLARFAPADILNPHKWEYWCKDMGWLHDKEAYAMPLWGNYQDEMFAEPTFVWHEGFKKWIAVYYNEIKNRIVLRSADELTGNWSEEQLIASGVSYPSPYGGFIYPLGLDGESIYISLSQWDPLYNVFLMKVDLKLKKK
ncbi:MAG: DUF4185 domain-containing protein [Bacteroidales bacterium]|nr:DUF4185 domain-containing protein [Bacteroidales bacterium]